MTNGFEMHGLDHVSPSSGNLYAAAPAVWLIEKLLGFRAPGSAAMHRGTAAERGIEMGLFDHSLPVAECQAHALDEYDRLTALSGDPNRAKERDAVPGLVETALAELRQYGVPDRPEGGRQHKVSVTLEGVPVPCVGYIDFLYTERGRILDLKTQLRLASGIPNNHARQFAVYQAAHGNFDAWGYYCTPKKGALYRLDEPRQHLETLRQIFLRMERFLRLSRDPLELAALVVPDLDSFYLNEPTTRAKVREVYGM